MTSLLVMLACADPPDGAWSVPLEGGDSSDVVDSAPGDASSADSGAQGSSDSAVPSDSASDSGRGDTGADTSGGASDSVGETGGMDTADTGVSDSGSDTGASSPPTVRFIAVGDAGDGGAGQRAVAVAMGDVCARRGCDMILYLGDNFYPTGVTSTTDAQWTTKFEDVYVAPSLAVPFWPVLGNHDYGLVYDASRAQAQVDYSASSSRWSLPGTTWSRTLGDAFFLGLDTEAWAQDDGAAQQPWAEAELAMAGATWRFAVGHHPYLSNGHHGDAGTWDARPGEGAAFRDFFDASLCGSVDAYLFGHDHLLQWLDAPCGVMLLGSGAGGRATTVTGSHATRFVAAYEGFLWVEVVGRTLRLAWYDEAGVVMHEALVTK